MTLNPVLDDTFITPVRNPISESIREMAYNFNWAALDICRLRETAPIPSRSARHILATRTLPRAVLCYLIDQVAFNFTHGPLRDFVPVTPPNSIPFIILTVTV